MKTIPIALHAHYEGKARTLALGLKFTRTDGEVFSFTSHDRDITVGGTEYIAQPKAQIQALLSAAGFRLDNTEVETRIDSLGITESDLLAGRWNGASWELIRFNWKAPADGFEVVKTGRIGAVTQKNGRWVCELQGESQDTRVNVGALTTPTCRYRHGGPQCGVDLGPYTVTGTFTSSGNRWHAADTARTEADDWFTEAELTITSGDNAGLSRKVVAYAADTFTFGEAFPFDIGTAAYSVHAGCMRRLEQDCAGKFGNGRRFGGEPHLPGQDRLQRRPE